MTQQLVGRAHCSSGSGQVPGAALGRAGGRESLVGVSSYPPAGIFTSKASPCARVSAWLAVHCPQPVVGTPGPVARALYHLPTPRRSLPLRSLGEPPRMYRGEWGQEARVEGGGVRPPRSRASAVRHRKCRETPAFARFITPTVREPGSVTSFHRCLWNPMPAAAEHPSVSRVMRKAVEGPARCGRPHCLSHSGCPPRRRLQWPITCPIEIQPNLSTTSRAALWLRKTRPAMPGGSFRTTRAACCRTPAHPMSAIPIDCDWWITESSEQCESSLPSRPDRRRRRSRTRSTVASEEKRRVRGARSSERTSRPDLAGTTRRLKPAPRR